MEITKREMRIFKRVLGYYVQKVCPVIIMGSLLLAAGVVGGYEAGNISLVRFVVYFVLCLLALCFAIANQD